MSACRARSSSRRAAPYITHHKSHHITLHSQVDLPRAQLEQTGCTAVAALLTPRDVVCAWVGDSPPRMAREVHEGRASRVTRGGVARQEWVAPQPRVTGAGRRRGWTREHATIDDGMAVRGRPGIRFLEVSERARTRHLRIWSLHNEEVTVTPLPRGE